MLPPELVNGAYSYGNTLNTQHLRHGQPVQPFVAFNQAAVAVDNGTQLVFAYIGLESEAVHIFHIEPVLVEITQDARRRVKQYALVVQAQWLPLPKFFHQLNVVVAGGEV